MRKKFALFAVILGLNAFSFVGEALAKPYYCTEAFINCANACGDGLFGAGCRVGCWIGYENCGS
ncbi:MAG: hypothetical protein HY089_02810 [Ignavibacteriales bacterium]|nr:hypothetical protein [Ignavibacteriales bacterium]